MSGLDKSNLNLSTFAVNLDLDNYFHFHSLIYRKLMINDGYIEAFDFLLANIMLLLLSPVMLIIIMAIKIQDGGAAFYSQQRVGRDGKLFHIYKFRTMIADAEAKTGPMLATKNDQRITRLGNFLRKSHLDELPQLINVIKGEMAFLGPRPERPEFVKEYDEYVPLYSLRKLVKPGISGLAQISLRYDATAFEKIKYDLIFIENRHYIIFNFFVAVYTLKKILCFNSFKYINER